MLKNILEINGAQELSKNEQQKITGGGPPCSFHSDCPNNPLADCCWQGVCISSADKRCAGAGF